MNLVSLLSKLCNRKHKSWNRREMIKAEEPATTQTRHQTTKLRIRLLDLSSPIHLIWRMWLAISITRQAYSKKVQSRKVCEIMRFLISHSTAIKKKFTKMIKTRSKTFLISACNQFRILEMELWWLFLVRAAALITPSWILLQANGLRFLKLKRRKSRLRILRKMEEIRSLMSKFSILTVQIQRRLNRILRWLIIPL